jgi:hypothetical protein
LAELGIPPPVVEALLLTAEVFLRKHQGRSALRAPPAQRRNPPSLTRKRATARVVTTRDSRPVTARAIAIPRAVRPAPSTLKGKASPPMGLSVARGPGAHLLTVHKPGMRPAAPPPYHPGDVLAAAHVAFAAARHPGGGPPVSESKGSSWSAGSVRTRGNAVVIRARDYLGTVVGGAGFTVQSYRVNPGLADTFERLAEQSVLFEQWSFRRMGITFEPVQGTTSAGSLALFMELNPDDPVPESMVEFMMNSRAVVVNIWQAPDGATYAVTPAILNDDLKVRYIRQGSLAEDEDIKFYDAGLIRVAMSDIADDLVDVTLGRLFIEYEVELLVPHLDDRLVAFNKSFTGHIGSVAATNAPFNSDFTAPTAGYWPAGGLYPTQPADLSGSVAVQLGGTSYFAGQNVTFPHRGFYVMTIDVIGSGTPTITITVPTGGFQQGVVTANIVPGTSVYGYSTFTKSGTYSIHCTEPNGFIAVELGGTVTVLNIAILHGTFEPPTTANPSESASVSRFHSDVQERCAIGPSSSDSRPSTPPPGPTIPVVASSSSSASSWTSLRPARPPASRA